MTTICIANPWNNNICESDITDLSQEELDQYAMLMDDEVREELCAEMSPCSAGEFLAAWANKVGPYVAGSVILSC